MENQENKPAENPEPKLSELVDRAEKVNTELKQLIARQEELRARQIVSGETQAGVQPPEKKEETPGEYAKRIMKGNL